MTNTRGPNLRAPLTAVLAAASVALAVCGYNSLSNRTPTSQTASNSPTNQVSVVEGIANAAKGLYTGMTSSSSDNDTLSEIRARYAFLKSGLRSSDPYVRSTAIEGIREYLQSTGLLGTPSRLMAESPFASSPEILSLSQEMNDLLNKCE
jgi:hypothetical protein